MTMILNGAVRTASDAAAGDLYGSSVAISGNGLVMAVGAAGWEGAYGTNIGGVYIYDLVGGSWVPRSSIVPGIGDSSAVAVALNYDGSILAIGISQHSTSLGQKGGVIVMEWAYGSVWIYRNTFTVYKAIDGALYDNFGCAVALDSTGNILAVGATGWEGTYTNQGGVYIYDWSGTTYVQRGSVITASDAAAGDAFGSGVALNAAGTILAVGAPNWEYSTYDNYGCVYVFDWTGSTWTERVARAGASDFAAEDRFGTSVSLSQDGLTMAAGAIWKVRPSGQSGGVYVLTWSGTAWVSQETVLADDNAEFDNYGQGIALFPDASGMVIGAPNWEGTATDQGGIYIYEATPGLVADITSPITIIIGERGDITSPITISVREVADIVSSIRVHVTTVADITSPIRINVYDPVIFSQAAVQTNNLAGWRWRIVLAGVDVSGQCVGTVSVDAESDAARVGRFSMVLATAFNPTQWQGSSVTIDYVIGTTAWRLMTGRIASVRVDVFNARVDFTVADARHGLISQAAPDQLDLMSPNAYHSGLLYGDASAGAYLRQRMAGVLGSLDMSPYGVLRASSWQEAAPVKTFTEAEIYDGSLRVNVADASTSSLGGSPGGKVIKITVAVRNQRLRSARANVAWSSGGASADQLPFLPDPDLIMEALKSLDQGWQSTNAVLTYAPPQWVGASQKAAAMSARLVRRWLQEVERTYIYTLRESGVAADAKPTDELQLLIETAYDETAWVERGEIVPTTNPVSDLVAEANASIAAAINAVQKQIAADNRKNSITFATPLDPTLDLPYTYAVDTDSVTAIGRSEQITHEMDSDAGSATTTLSLALFGAPSSAGAIAGSVAPITPTVNVTAETIPEIVIRPANLATQIVIMPPSSSAPNWALPGWSVEIHKTFSSATQTDTLTELDIDSGRISDITGKVLSYRVDVNYRYDVIKSQFLIIVPNIPVSETEAVTSQHQEDFFLNLPSSLFEINF